MNYVIKFINLILNLIVDFINSIISLLPNSPFSDIQLTLDNKLLSYLNWIVPFSKIIKFLAIVVVTYYGYVVFKFIIKKVGLI